jgi:hypothetical protein
MKFWIDIKLVGSVGDLDSLVKKLGYHKDEVALLTDSQDTESIHEYFGKPGQASGVNGFSGFFVVARDGDYDAIWGFHGNIPYIIKDLYQVIWKLVDEREYNVLQTRFARYPHSECPHCKGHAIEHTATKDGWRWLVSCPKREANLVAA